MIRRWRMTKLVWHKIAIAAIAAMAALVCCGPEPSVLEQHGWIHGTWFRSCDTKDVMISFIVSADRIEGLTGMEAQAQSDPPRRGRVHVEGVSKGYTRFRPQNWLNSELRLKQVGAGQADAILARRDATEMIWDTSERFALYQCSVISREGEE
ncbi:MAG: hypothetical protein RH862_03650 [Leptospiraceae bacterium]